VLFGSVTDVYQPIEGKLGLMRDILPLFIDSGCGIEILTKSPLVLRDIDILQRIPDATVGISLATLDDQLHSLIEQTASPRVRLDVLKRLKDAGIDNFLFMSPIFPGLNDVEELIDLAARHTGTICFENLNLRGNNRGRILSLIKNHYPDRLDLFRQIYECGDIGYWNAMENVIREKCKTLGVIARVYFHHDSAPADDRQNRRAK
jgi:DNA repair photolyase